ncbi:hypothetical protein [Streptomyces sp. NPDC089799]|uniref:hypothetical protein n=1 Tax=Streptomyces sp. NPDC089799 TaxID=3155066 RepID=UPI00341394D3
MRPSARISTVLAGLTLAAGAVVFAGPTAHANMQQCEQAVAQAKMQVSDAVKQACYEGQIGNQTSCSASLVQAGISNDVAAKACRVAPK